MCSGATLKRESRRDANTGLSFMAPNMPRTRASNDATMWIKPFLNPRYRAKSRGIRNMISRIFIKLL